MLFPEAVFLDVGWTLVYPKDSLWDVLARAMRDAGKSSTAGEIEQLVFTLMKSHAEHAISQFEAGKTEYSDSDEKFREIFRNLGRAVFLLLGVEAGHDELMEATLRRFWDFENWAVFPDAIPAMEQLRAKGIPIFALSNAGSELVAFLGKMGLAGYMDAMIVSAIEGTRKPDPRIFRRALDRAGVAPAKAVHVGDMFLEDVLGARNAGIPPFLMDRGPRGMFPTCGQPVDIRAQKDVDVVGSLFEVLQAVGFPEGG